MTITLFSAVAGLGLAVLYSASPLTVWALVAGVAVCLSAGRDLPPAERRLLVVVLAAALSARLLVVGAVFLSGLPHLNDLSVGALSGDEAYYLGRALRVRDILLGFTNTKYDYFVATDEYGHTSYLTLLSWIQVAFGPTPYGMRLVNALLFVGGATMLFRIARTTFGSLPAFLGLIIVLFLPSLFVASVSLLKESLYFFVSSLLLVCVVQALRPRAVITIVMAVPMAAACLWMLNDLRRGALVLAAAGLALGIGARFAAGNRWRLAATGALGVGIVVFAMAQPAIRSRALDAVVSMAKTHAGHVFTVGHAYKLMDPGFYVTPEEPGGWDLRLTEPQAARFLVRAAVSFLVTPLPWHMVSRGELAFLPEHVLWYVTLLLLPAGIIAGWKRDPFVTSLLVGFVVPTAAALALTNGNVGTLLRLRGLVSPYLVWVSALGACAMADSLVSGRWFSGRLRPPSVAHGGSNA